MRNTFKLGYEKTNNSIKYLMVLVVLILLISYHPFQIHGMPLIAITSMPLSNFYHFAIYFLLEPVPCALLVYPITMRK